MLKFSMCFTMRPAHTGVKTLEHMLLGMSQERLGSAVSASRKKQDIPTIQYRYRLIGRWSTTKMRDSHGIILFLK